MFFIIIAMGSRIISVYRPESGAYVLIGLVSFSALCTLVPVCIDMIRCRLFNGKMIDLIEPGLREKFK